MHVYDLSRLKKPIDGNGLMPAGGKPDDYIPEKEMMPPLGCESMLSAKFSL